jgi:hypothetical protein
MHEGMMARRDPRLPSTAVVRALAARIGCDPRSVEREIISHGSVSGVAGARVRSTLAQLGVGPSLPPLDPFAVLAARRS